MAELGRVSVLESAVRWQPGEVVTLEELRKLLQEGQRLPPQKHRGQLMENAARNVHRALANSSNELTPELVKKAIEWVGLDYGVPLDELAEAVEELDPRFKTWDEAARAFARIAQANPRLVPAGRRRVSKVRLRSPKVRLSEWMAYVVLVVWKLVRSEPHPRGRTLPRLPKATAKLVEAKQKRESRSYESK